MICGWQRVHVRLHEEDAVFPNRLQHFHRLVVMNAQGFFAKNMFFRLRGAERPFPMLGVGRGDVNDVDIGIRQERLVRSMRMGKLVKPGKIPCFFRGAAGHRDQVAGLRTEDAAGKFMRDGSGPDDAPAKLGHVRKNLLGQPASMSPWVRASASRYVLLRRRVV